MTSQRGLVFQSAIGCALLLFASCSGGSSGGGTSGGAQAGQNSTSVTGAGGTRASAGTTTVAGSSNSGGQATGTTDGSSATGGTGGGQTTGATSSQAGKTASNGGSTNGGTVSSGQAAGSTSRGGQVGGTTGGGTGGQAGSTGNGGRTGDGGQASACVGKEWPTAATNAAGPFEVAADKKIGPLAGYTPDPVYGDEQQRFNIYRPKNLAQSGYCHPILVWANGHTDNPEPNPPKCVVDAGANKWCGTYRGLMNHLASHGFVVIASLSTTTSKGDPLPTIVGLNWLLEQAEDATSPYYHRLDTAHIGALGHSEGGMSTCKAAADPRITAIATVSGTSTITSIHGPALFFCGGKEGASVCDKIQNVASSVKDQPSMFINNLNADHGSWTGEGARGPDFTGLAAWFRYHLMGDAANGKMFYGASCTFCTDSRVKVQRNDLMTK